MSTATRLINYTHGMSRERFKQEAALIALDRLMESIADKIADRFHGTKPASLSKALGQWEESKARVIAGVAEAIADSLAHALGPDTLPRDER